MSVIRAFDCRNILPFIRLLFVQRTHLPLAPVSMAVIYRSRNNRSFVLLEYSLTSISSFILYNGLSQSQAQVEAIHMYYNDKNFNLSRELKDIKMPCHRFCCCCEIDLYRVQIFSSIARKQGHHRNDDQAARRRHILCSICVHSFGVLPKATQLLEA